MSSSPPPTLKQLLEEQNIRLNLSESDDAEEFIKRRQKRKRRVSISTPRDEEGDRDVDFEGTNYKRVKTSYDPVPQKEPKSDYKLVHQQASSDPDLTRTAITTLSSGHRATPGISASPRPRKEQEAETTVSPKTSISASESSVSKTTATEAPVAKSTLQPAEVINLELNVTTTETPRVDEVPPPKSKPKKASRPKSEAAILKEEAKQKRAKERADKLAKEKAKKELEAREKRMTSVQYAATLQEKWKGFLAKQPESKLCFKGCNILFVGDDLRIMGESTKKKMDKIVQRGGNLMPTFDPKVTTHIIGIPSSRPHILKALGIGNPREIPKHIPTLDWSWAIKKMLGRSELFILHELFAERLEEPIVGNGKKPVRKVKDPALPPRYESQQDSSDIEESTAEMFRMRNEPGPSTHVKPLLHIKKAPASRSSSREGFVSDSEASEAEDEVPNSDPLALFYEEARAQKEEEVQMSDDEKANREIPSRTLRCDKVKQSSSPNPGCPNQDIVDKLLELQGLHSAKPTKDDHWRNFSYNKSIRNIKAHSKRIKSYAEARSIPSVGHKTALKIMEIIETGDLERIQTETTEDVITAKLFMLIYGVGPNIAYSWYAMGLRTLDDVRSRKYGIKLSPAQELGLRYHKDINERMPREEVRYIFERIKNVALELDSQLYMEVMGSYRRGKADCGDIDILITRPVNDGKTHSGIMRKLLRFLHVQDILTHDLSVPEDLDDLETSYRGLCQMHKGGKQRRIDILCVPYECLGGALIYYTGDDIFNRSIRLKASSMGYSLNQRGLSVGVIRDPRDRNVKLDEGTLLKGKSEKEIFKLLGVPWQEPHERIRE